MGFGEAPAFAHAIARRRAPDPESEATGYADFRERIKEERRADRRAANAFAGRRRQGTDRPNKNHNLRMKSPDSKYLIDAPAFSEHHGREWPTNKTTDIYLSAINLQRSPFNTSDMRLFPRSMEASGGLQKRC
jgi:hypothetical protein